MIALPVVLDLDGTVVRTAVMGPGYDPTKALLRLALLDFSTQDCKSAESY